MTKITKARQRGIYPETVEPYNGPSVPITIHIPATLWNWLKEFVGRNSFTANVEETVITALRCMAGRDCMIGMDVETLIDLICGERNVSAAEAMFGRIGEDASRHANLLLQASQFAARGIEDAAESGLPDDKAQADAVLKVWSAAAAMDMAEAITKARLKAQNEEAEIDRLMADEESGPDAAPSDSGQNDWPF